jgi:pimeloyl-ACP methyl ester carboxylesterase
MGPFALAVVCALSIALTVPALARAGPALQRCSFDPRARCGTIERALDPAGHVPGMIRVHFAILPHADARRPAEGAIVGAEGGPGYGSIGSYSLYRALFAPLLDRRDLLLVDSRGTGGSGAIDCAPLQREPVMLLEDVARCGAQLGNTADLYGTGLAADDLAAVLDTLGIAKIDLYGDSYGTYFAQAFAGRHPERLRSLVLDGAYPVVGGSPWYPSESPTMRHAFDVVCERALGCNDVRGTSMERIKRLLEALRAAPRSVAVPGDSHARTVRLDPVSLAFIMFASGLEPVAFRELDAAARAYLDDSDAVPLARLASENLVGNEAAGSARSYSRGLFSAVSCSDYPQAYDMRGSFAERASQWHQALRREQSTEPDVYAPFTIAEFLGIPPDFSVPPLCLEWPVPSRAHLPGQPVPPGARFTRAPTLVLSGELDSITTPAEADAASALFRNKRHIVFANSWHVDAIGDLASCASAIVRRFVERLDTGDVSCARRIHEVRTVPAFARSISDVSSASPLPGNRGTVHDLRAVAAAVQTVGDVVARSWIVRAGSTPGLRGGRFDYRSDGAVTRFRLSGTRWVEDLAVSGSSTWNTATGAIVSRVTVAGSGTTRGDLAIRWSDIEPHAFVSVAGDVDGRHIVATMPAP